MDHSKPVACMRTSTAAISAITVWPLFLRILMNLVLANTALNWALQAVPPAANITCTSFAQVPWRKNGNIESLCRSCVLLSEPRVHYLELTAQILILREQHYTALRVGCRLQLDIATRQDARRRSAIGHVLVTGIRLPRDYGPRSVQ